MPETRSRNDLYSAFNFLLEIDGISVAGFSECSGLTTETDVIRYREGDENIIVRKLPGLKIHTNISLKRGFTDSKELWAWRRKVIEGKIERKPGSIVFLNEARDEALRWTFREGWLSKWEGPTFNAKNNEVAIETLEIAVEELVIV